MKRKPDLPGALDALQQRVNDATDALRECVKESKDPYMAVWESNQFLAGVRNRLSVAESMLPPYDEEPHAWRGFPIDGFPSPSQCSDSKWTGFGITTSPVSVSERRALFDAFKAKERARLKRRRKITGLEVAKAIGYSSTTELYAWRRNDPSHATPGAMAAVERFFLRECSGLKR
jgi:hypothetical protein